MADEKTTKTYHITFDDAKNQWCVRAEESSRANKYFKTKEEAEDYAKQLASKNPDARVVRHKKDGKFQKSR